MSQALLNYSFKGVHIHHKPKPPIHHLLQTSQMTKSNTNPSQPVFTTTNPIPTTPPQSWLEAALKGHALTFTMYVEGKECLVIIQNPKDLSQIITEGMKLGLEAFAHQQWYATPPSIPNSFRASPSNVYPPVLTNLMMSGLSVYPQLPQEMEVMSWI
ncbi:hypothetical protein FXO38_34021, partial [Capsicum annuum]